MVNFDDVLKELNDFGKYQKVRYLLICLAGLLPPIVTYLHSFAAPSLKHRCRNPLLPNDAFALHDAATTEEFEYGECTVLDRASNESKQCAEWVFAKTYYQTTLTEDLAMVCDNKFMRGQMQTVYFMGYLIGSIIMGILADRFGRRPIMLSSFFLILIGGFGAAFGPQSRQTLDARWSFFIYSACRFLIACGTRGINVTGFVLGMEMMGPTKRTFAGIVIEYFFAFGQLILVLFAFFIRDWRTLAWAVMIPAIPFLSYFFFLPESPRWLISKNRQDEALTIVEHIAHVNKREVNMNTWQQFLASQASDSGHHKDKAGEHETLLSLRRYPLLLLMSLVLFLNWIINNFIFYGIGLVSNSLGFNPYFSFALGAGVELLAYIVVHLLLDILGRKYPYCVSLLLAGASCIAVFFLRDHPFAILFMAMVGKFSASAAYAIIYLYSSELFPTSIRNSCMGACSMFARVGSMVAPLINDMDLFGKYSNFLVFGIAALVGSTTSFILPETLQRELPQTVAEANRMNKLGVSYKPTHLHQDANESELKQLNASANQ